MRSVRAHLHGGWTADVDLRELGHLVEDGLRCGLWLCQAWAPAAARPPGGTPSASDWEVTSRAVAPQEQLVTPALELEGVEQLEAVGPDRERSLPPATTKMRPPPALTTSGSSTPHSWTLVRVGGAVVALGEGL